MNRVIWIAALALAMAFPITAPAGADQFDDGLAAYKIGDFATALRLWRPLAEQGDADAQYNMGTIYDNGNGVPQDIAEAVKWYRLAAEQGLARAQLAMAIKFRSGEGVAQDSTEADKWSDLSGATIAYKNGDFTTALSYLRRLTEQGHADAQTMLGHMYRKGQGVPQDFAEAAKWYRLAAEQGDADAQSDTGTMYYIGQGVPQDFAEAVKWYRLAAAQGYTYAQNMLGFMYYNGKGVPRDIAEAVKWYRLAAEQGYADAQFSLGAMYDSGEVVPQDIAEAVKWYRLAAEQGQVDAQFNLGNWYSIGQGVPQDFAEAAKWYRLAAEQGDADAQFSLGNMYHNGEGVPQDFGEAVKWFRLAAEQGQVDAQFNLGTMYYNGEGVPQDFAEATKWYRLAAEQGDAEAKTVLESMQSDEWLHLHATIDDAVEALNRGDRDVALKVYRILADKGDTRAMAQIVFMYDEDVQNLPVAERAARTQEALKWLEAGAATGNMQETLGDAYEKGLYGLKPDYAMALFWWNDCFDRNPRMVYCRNSIRRLEPAPFWKNEDTPYTSGPCTEKSPTFCKGLSFMYSRDYGNAVEVLTPLAVNNDRIAQWLLGRTFLSISQKNMEAGTFASIYNSVIGDDSIAKAEHWLKLAANGGSQIARADMKRKDIVAILYPEKKAELEEKEKVDDKARDNWDRLSCRNMNCDDIRLMIEAVRYRVTKLDQALSNDGAEGQSYQAVSIRGSTLDACAQSLLNAHQSLARGSVIGAQVAAELADNDVRLAINWCNEATEQMRQLGWLR